MSRLTLAQVRAWQPDRLGTAAAGVSRAVTSVEQAAGGTRSTMEDLQSTWDGDAAGAAADRAAEERRTGLALADALEQARGIALETDDDGLSSVPEPVLASLGGALLRADVVVRHLGDEAPALSGAFSGPGGTYLTSGEPGQAPVTRPVAVDEARRRLMDAVEAGRAAVEHG